MKTRILALLSLGFASALAVAAVRSNDQSQNVVPGKDRIVYDIFGKRLGPDEKYLLEMALKNGRVVAYRKNEREVAALVKALKEDGVTEKRLLDPKAWVMINCERSVSSGCQGGCGLPKVCKGFRDAIDRISGSQLQNPINYCYCVP